MAFPRERERERERGRERGGERERECVCVFIDAIFDKANVFVIFIQSI